MPIDVLREWEGGRPREVAAPACPLDLVSGVSAVICTRGRPEALSGLLRSLGQQRALDELVVIDASSDAASEEVVAQFAEGATRLRARYARVNGEFRGLTRQRNVGASLASRELSVFFDDDVVVEEGCLEAMVRAYRDGAGVVVGVGASVVGPEAPSLGIWRLRRALGLVPSLAPGRYFGSGMSSPWSPEGFRETTSVDWLPGCAMLWPTRLVRGQQFREEFEGYAQGEDLEFSLRAARFGGLRVAQGARVRDIHAPTGRPRGVARGYFGLRNRFLIHRLRPENRTAPRVGWFVYTWTVDTLLLLRHLVYPRRWAPAVQEMAGRVLAGWDLMRGRGARRFEERGSA